MSPTSYQTAPPRISMVTYRPDPVNSFKGFSGIFGPQTRCLSSNDGGDMLRLLMASTPFRSPMVSGLPYYVWEVPDKKISIQLHFDVIDRMSPEILRGFGALKRRGAEVGGILLGRSEDGPVRK